MYKRQVETVTEVVENVEQATTDPVGWFGGVVEGVVDTVEDIADDPGGWFADTVDEYVFDTVDFVTAGAVNIDYEDGTFSASAGIDGVASYGVSVGEDGFEMSGEFDVGIASGEVSLGDEGFTGSASAGVDWGPLPYAEGHVEVSENGDISVGGQVQGTIPTPYGIVSGSAEGGFYRNEDGSWGANVAADGSIITPAGVTVGANVGGSKALTRRILGVQMDGARAAARRQGDNGAEVVDGTMDEAMVVSAAGLLPSSLTRPYAALTNGVLSGVMTMTFFRQVRFS